jgi:uncharacterized membrane protein YqaE (UPF0057 family)
LFGKGNKGSFLIHLKRRSLTLCLGRKLVGNVLVIRSSKEVWVDLLRIVVAILLPPLGVFLQVGLTKHFWINILLTLLGYIPGIVHAVWVIAKY